MLKNTTFEIFFKNSKKAFASVIAFSCIINILALTGSLYMLQVYDRVIPSHSIATLIALSFIMIALYGVNTGIDIYRSQIMTRIASQMDESLRDRIGLIMIKLPILYGQTAGQQNPLRDLDQIRNFLSGQGPVALFDMPWMPFYMILVYLLHPALGILACAGALILCFLTYLTEKTTKQPQINATQSAHLKSRFMETAIRSSESIAAMGMAPSILSKLSKLSDISLQHTLEATDRTSALSSLSKSARMVLQSGMLGLGAYLVIFNEASSGVIIASSIMMSRALSPIEVAIAHWKSFQAARQGYARLKNLMQKIPEDIQKIILPKPEKNLNIEKLSAGAPGTNRAIVHSISLNLTAGQGLAIIGRSASGKSTLAKALVNAWKPLSGSVRLDGNAIHDYSDASDDYPVGYLPQDVDLHDGNIAQNIARMHHTPDADAVYAAARQAGVHDMISKLPQGYNTVIGYEGISLSGGQKQRIGLARALYKNPFLIVLDEPNSNLDNDGDQALLEAILSIRRRKGIVVVIAHRPSILAGLDVTAYIAEGQCQAFGPTAEVLKKIQSQAAHSQQTSNQTSAQANIDQRSESSIDLNSQIESSNLSNQNDINRFKPIIVSDNT